MARRKPRPDTTGLKPGQLIFRYSQVESELESAAVSLKDFLDRTAPDLLRRLREDLRQHRSSRSGRQISWSTKDSPISTIPSKGEYERGKKQRGKLLFGKVSFIWHIRSLWTQNADPKKCDPRFFCLDGNASVRVMLHEHPSEDSVAAWDFDVAKHDAPGCFFHAQVPDKMYQNKGLFMYPIPRLPVFIYTPMDALDFLLGELFQERWPAHVTEKRQAFDTQRSNQSRRFRQTLKWLLDIMGESGGGSVWSYMKGQKPEVDLLLEA